MIDINLRTGLPLCVNCSGFIILLCDTSVPSVSLGKECSSVNQFESLPVFKREIYDTDQESRMWVMGIHADKVTNSVTF